MSAPGGTRAGDPWTRAVDLAFALALTAVALTGFETTYSGRHYLVVAMIGAVACVVVAALAADSGGAPFLGGALFAYVLVGTMVVMGDPGSVAAPTSDALLTFLEITVTGVEHLLTTIPPLDSDGGGTIVPFELAFVTAGASAWLAVRTRRPVLPLVPVLMCAAVVILVGSLETSDLVLRGGVLALLGLLWTVLRAGRSVPAAESGRFRWARPLVVAVIVLPAVAAATVVVQGADLETRATLRGKVGSGAEVDESDNPLIRFRQYTLQTPGNPTVYSKPLLRLDGLPDDTPIRFVALDMYDGEAWRAGNRTVGPGEDDLFQRIGSQIYTVRRGRPVEVEVDLTRYYSPGWLPQSDQLTSVEFAHLDGRAQRSDVRYNPATASAMVVGGLAGPDDYSYTAVVPRDRLTERMRPFPTSGPLQQSGAPLDRLLRPWRRSALTPMEQVFSLAQYLRRNGRYSDGMGDPSVPPGHDIDRLAGGFFGATRIVGDDEQYAAFMALAANRLGVPARVVVGAVPRRTVVRGRDVSAWVEVRVADGSWRRLPTAAFMSHRPARRNDAPTQRPPSVVRPDRADAPTQPQQQPPPEAQPREPDHEEPADRRPWVLSALVVLVGAVPGAKLVRRWRRRRAGNPAMQVAAGWRDLIDSAIDLGRRPSTGLTRAGQATELGVTADAAELADRLVFGRRAPNAAEAADFWRRLVDERRRVSIPVRPVRRIVAWWDPRSLVSRRRADPAASSRRSLSPESTGPERRTSHPTPARDPRATRARAGR